MIWTEHEIRELVRMKAAGLKDREIAAKLGKSRQAVKTKRQRIGIFAKRGRPRLNDQKYGDPVLAELSKKIDQDKRTLEQIAERAGVSRASNKQIAQATTCVIRNNHFRWWRRWDAAQVGKYLIPSSFSCCLLFRDGVNCSLPTGSYPNDHLPRKQRPAPLVDHCQGRRQAGWAHLYDPVR